MGRRKRRPILFGRSKAKSWPRKTRKEHGNEPCNCSRIVLGQEPQYGRAMNGASPDGLLYQNEAFQIRGAAFEVYRALGAGFLEAVYQECLEIEFTRRG